MLEGDDLMSLGVTRTTVESLRIKAMLKALNIPEYMGPILEQLNPDITITRIGNNLGAYTITLFPFQSTSQRDDFTMHVIPLTKKSQPGFLSLMNLFINEASMLDYWILRREILGGHDSGYTLPNWVVKLVQSKEEEIEKYDKILNSDDAESFHQVTQKVRGAKKFDLVQNCVRGIKTINHLNYFTDHKYKIFHTTDLTFKEFLKWRRESGHDVYESWDITSMMLNVVARADKAKIGEDTLAPVFGQKWNQRSIKNFKFPYISVQNTLPDGLNCEDREPLMVQAFINANDMSKLKNKVIALTYYYHSYAWQSTDQHMGAGLWARLDSLHRFTRREPWCSDEAFMLFLALGSANGFFERRKTYSLYRTEDTESYIMDRRLIFLVDGFIRQFVAGEIEPKKAQKLVNKWIDALGMNLIKDHARVMYMGVYDMLSSFQILPSNGLKYLSHYVYILDSWLRNQPKWKVNRVMTVEDIYDVEMALVQQCDDTLSWSVVTKCVRRKWLKDYGRACPESILESIKMREVVGPIQSFSVMLDHTDLCRSISWTGDSGRDFTAEYGYVHPEVNEVSECSIDCECELHKPCGSIEVKPMSEEEIIPPEFVNLTQEEVNDLPDMIPHLQPSMVPEDVTQPEPLVPDEEDDFSDERVDRTKMRAWKRIQVIVNQKIREARDWLLKDAFRQFWDKLKETLPCIADMKRVVKLGINTAKGFLNEIIKCLVTSSSDVFSFDSEGWAENLMYYALPIIFVYVCYQIVDSTLIRSILAMILFKKIGLYDKVLAWASSYLQVIETSGESIFENIFEWITKIDVANLTPLVSLFSFLALSAKVSASHAKPVAATIIEVCKNLHHIGAGFFGIDRILRYSRTFVSEIVKTFSGSTKEENTKAILEWYIFVNSLDNERGYVMIEQTKAIRERIVAYEALALQARVFATVNTELDNVYRNDILRTHKAYNKLFGIAYRVEQYGQFRPVPLHFQFYSGPGLGKSDMMTDLTKYIGQEFYPDRDEYDLFYARGSTDHFDGYRGQPIYLVDDIWKIIDPTEITEIVPMISSVPLVLPMADLTDKGKHFTSEVMLTTTNVPYPMCNEVADMEAVHRRRDLLVEVRIRPEFRDKVWDTAQNRFSLSKFQTHYPHLNSRDYPHLVFDLHKPINKDGGDPYLPKEMLPGGLTLPTTNLSYTQLKEKITSMINYRRQTDQALTCEERRAKDFVSFATTHMQLTNLINDWELDITTVPLFKKPENLNLLHCTEPVKRAKAEKLNAKKTRTRVQDLRDEEDLIKNIYSRAYAMPFADKEMSDDDLDMLEAEMKRREAILKKKGTKYASYITPTEPIKKFGDEKYTGEDHLNRITTSNKKAVYVAIYPNMEYPHRKPEGTEYFGEPQALDNWVTETFGNWTARIENTQSNYENPRSIWHGCRYGVHEESRLYIAFLRNVIRKENVVGGVRDVKYYYNMYDFQCISNMYRQIRVNESTDHARRYLNECSILNIPGMSSRFDACMRQFFNLSEEQRVKALRIAHRAQSVIFAEQLLRNSISRVRKTYRGFVDAMSSTVGWAIQKVKEFLPLVAGVSLAIGTIYLFSKFFRGSKPKVEDKSRIFNFKADARGRNTLVMNRSACPQFETDLLAAVTRNTMAISCIQESDFTLISHNGVGISPCGKFILINRHTLRNIDLTKDWLLRFRPTTKSADTCDAVVRGGDTTIFKNEDVALVYSLQLPAFRDIRKMFITTADLQKEMQLSGSAWLVTVQRGYLTMVPHNSIETARNYTYIDSAGDDRHLAFNVSMRTPVSNGESGSPFLMPNPYSQRSIFGILSHTNPKLDLSVVNVVSREAIDQMITQIGKPCLEVGGPLISTIPEMRMVEVSEYQFELKPVHELRDDVFEGHHIDVEGTVPPLFQEGRVKDTDYIKTPIAPFFESNSRPAIIRDNDPDFIPDFGKVPMAHSVNKFGRGSVKHIPHIDEATNDIYNYIRAQIQSLHTTPIEIYTIEQSLTGKYPGEPHLPTKTSAGLPSNWLRYKGKPPGKKHFFEFTDDGELIIKDPSFIDDVANIRKGYEEGIYLARSTFDFPKDELRPEYKARTKTRSINVLDFCETILFRQTHMSLETKMHQLARRGDFQCCIGMDPASETWSVMYQRLNKFPHVLDLDVSNWDGHFTAELFFSVVDVINRLYEDVDESWCAKTRFGLADNAVFGWSQYKSVVYRKFRGMPSGFPGTALYNTIGHMILLRSIYLQLSKAIPNATVFSSMDYYINNFIVYIYGDDMICSISPEIIEFINAKTLTETYSSFGWPTTVADKKSTGLDFLSRDIRQCQFLKRHFKPDGYQGWNAPRSALSSNSIIDLLVWLRSSVDNNQQFRLNCFQALEFAEPHGREYYDDLLKQLNNALIITDHAPIYTTYDQMHSMLMARYYHIPECVYDGAAKTVSSISATC